jgi:hypothetical protein
MPRRLSARLWSGPVGRKRGIPRVRIEVIIVFWKKGVKEELDFALAKGFLNFDCLLGKESSHLICLKEPL